MDHVKDIDATAAAVVLALDFCSSNYDHGFAFVTVLGDFEVDDFHAEDGFFGVEYHSGTVRRKQIRVILRHLLVNDLLACGVDKLDCSLAHLRLEADLFCDVSREP